MPLSETSFRSMFNDIEVCFSVHGRPLLSSMVFLKDLLVTGKIFKFTFLPIGFKKIVPGSTSSSSVGVTSLDIKGLSEEILIVSTISFSVKTSSVAGVTISYTFILPANPVTILDFTYLLLISYNFCITCYVYKALLAFLFLI